MADVKVDIQEGGARITTDRGWEIRRVIMVYNLTEGEGYAKVKAATETAGVPQLYDEYPARIGCKLYEIQPEIIDSTTVKLVALYCDIFYNWNFPQPLPSNSVIQTGASVTQEETRIDRNGKGIYVPYKLRKHPAIASLLLPSTTITITREENADPSGIADAYVGKVNQSGWTLKPNDSQGRWLCMGITGISYDGGEHYTVTYTFQSRKNPSEGYFPNAEGWSSYLFYPDPETGGLPKDCVDDDGNITDGVWCWNVLPLANFNDLGLP